jgi:5'-nucleotidase
MRILLTNDDGVSSPGITLLAEALREAGHRAFVVAPDSDRSGVSHSITFLKDPCKLTEIAKDTWSCSGTPADCVVAALLGGIPELRVPDDADGPQDRRTPPDLLLSGINRGANIGTDLLYSGTAAAARQGSFIGIPSAALSLLEGEQWPWEMAVSFVMERLEEIRRNWKADTFVNVNIPNGAAPPRALVPAFPSVRYYNDYIEPYEAPGGGRYCFARAGAVGAKPEAGSDWDVTLRKQASISAVFIHPVLASSVSPPDGKGKSLP